MTGIRMSVKIDDREVLRHLSRTQARARNLRPAMKDIGEYMLGETQDRFSGEHDPEGQPWTPLMLRSIYGAFRGKRYTKRGKATKRFERFSVGKKILITTANLRNRIVYKAGSVSVAVGTNVIYAAIHQFGGKAGRGKKVDIPARPFLGINDADRREFIEIIKDHLRAA